MINVAAHSHFQSSCQGFEYAFNLVVLVLAFGLDVQIHLRCVAQTLEEVQEHLGGHLPRKSKETADMKTAALRAECDFEAGKCFSEADFKERFVKWL